MTTTVYIDILFLENFLLDFFILYITAKINNRRFRILRAVFGSFTGALYVCFQTFYNILFLAFPVMNIMLFISFKIRSFKEYLKFLFIYVSVNFILAGGIYFAAESLGKTNIISIFSGVVILAFTGKEIFMLIKESILKKEFTKETLLYYNDRIIKLKTFEDTGNFLVDPISKKSVVIVSKEKIKKLTDIENVSKIKNIRLIPCRTVADKFELLYGFKPDKFIYNGQKIDVVVAVAKDDFNREDFDAILNPLTLI